MQIPLIKLTLTGLTLAATASAHTIFSVLYVDGINQGVGTCIRETNSFNHTLDPIRPITSAEIACGHNGESAVNRVCPAASGSVLTFEFREKPTEDDSPSLDPPHMGPCSVYMKKVDSATESNNAAGDGWFKIWEETYDEENDIWCTDKMIDNDGHLSVQVPDDIEGGYYLVRPELLALHNATANPPDPQFYISCAQLFIESSGTATPATVDIGENFYNLSIPGLTYDIYTTPLVLPYPAFGAPVYKSGSSSAKAQVIPVQELGVKPAGSVLTNANWDGIELDSYSTEKGCWNASSACWNQSSVCFADAPPTGSANCELWNDKCNGINDACNAGNYNGPPDQGKDLNPVLTNLTGTATIFPMDAAAYSTHSDGYFTPTATGAGSTVTSGTSETSATGTLSSSSYAASATTFSSTTTLSQPASYTSVPASGLVTETVWVYATDAASVGEECDSDWSPKVERAEAHMRRSHRIHRPGNF